MSARITNSHDDSRHLVLQRQLAHERVVVDSNAGQDHGEVPTSEVHPNHDSFAVPSLEVNLWVRISELMIAFGFSHSFLADVAETYSHSF